MIRVLATTTALALLAGCGAQPGAGGANVTTVADTTAPVVPVASATPTPVAAPHVVLAPDGIVVASAGGAQRQVFSLERDRVLAVVEAALGQPTAQGSNAECGAGPLDNVDFPGGLTLFFQNGSFVGWNVDGRQGSRHKTEAGIGIGSTLAQLRDTGDVAVQDTSLGTEFSVAEINGLVTSNTPDGKVTDFWAGTTCAFR